MAVETVDKAMRYYYYLTAEEMQHYKYMLASNYERKHISLDNQQYLIFPVIDKPHIWVAWPTTTNGLDGVSGQHDAIFQPHVQLQSKIMPHAANSGIKVLLFPRYSS